MFLCIARCFINSERGINPLSETDPDTAFPVTNDYDETEVETSAAGHDARDAPRVDGHLIELAALARRSRSAGSAARAATAESAAAMGTLATRLRRGASVLLRILLRRCSHAGIRK